MSAAPSAPRVWQRLRAKLEDAASFRSWTIDANDGIIATAGLLQGFGGGGRGTRAGDAGALRR